jgi:hypothetical protein
MDMVAVMADSIGEEADVANADAARSAIATSDPVTGQTPDVDCNSLTSATTYTGPNEEWWAPYDNRPGSNVCTQLDGGYPRGILWPYVEQNPAIFALAAADRPARQHVPVVGRVTAGRRR